MATETTTFNAYDQYTHWTRKLRSTGGAMILAEERGAHWLIDAVASYQTAKLDAQAGGFQIWTLSRDAPHIRRKQGENGAVLECWRDIPRAGVKDETPLVRQYIEYTDFPLVCGKFPGFRLYVEGEGSDRVLMLPEER